MDLVYERGSIGSGELEELLSGNPTSSAVRTHLRILESKGFLKHEDAGGRFRYYPVKGRAAVAAGEMARLVTTFFGGSVTATVAGLLDQEKDRLSAEQIAELKRMIEKVEEEGR